MYISKLLTFWKFLWSPILRSKFARAHLSSPPPIGSYGLYLGILRNSVPSSGLHLPWPPMVFTTEISVCSCPSLISTTYGLIWSPPWHTQKLCGFIRTPPSMASYGLHSWDLSLLVPFSHLHHLWAHMVPTLVYSETLCLHQDATFHGLLWSPLLRSQFSCAHLTSPPLMGSYGLHLGILSNSVPLTEHHLLWTPMICPLKIPAWTYTSLISTSLGSYGLHIGIFGIYIHSSLTGHHLLWTPMISPLKIPARSYPSLISTYHGLL
jgi:hypothetical protein